MTGFSGGQAMRPPLLAQQPQPDTFTLQYDPSAHRRLCATVDTPQRVGAAVAVVVAAIAHPHHRPAAVPPHRRALKRHEREREQ